MKSYWHGLLKIRAQRVSQAKQMLAAARAEQTKCEAACVQVQQRIEKLQQALHRNELTVSGQAVPLDRVLIGQQHRQGLRRKVDREIEQLQRARAAYGKACRISAAKAARYLLMMGKQENAQQQRRDEQRVAAQRAVAVEEELAAEQWCERYSTSGVPTLRSLIGAAEHEQGF